MTRKITKSLFLFLLLPTMAACGSLQYYSQAISGHLDLISKEQPIEELVDSPQTPERLRQQLVLSLQAREYATRELHLPDNDSYKSYVDLQRPYVVWNVVATPPYSIKPRQWCYLVVGCLSYRGIFDKNEAVMLADTLKKQGKDVSVFGGIAYSTLGYFDDPLLNTMMQQGNDIMIGTIFHELAHQTVYVPNDTAFNEAFATAVEQEGLRRWYNEHDNHDAYEKYIQSRRYRHEFYTLAIRTRQKLQTAFRLTASDADKQSAKQAIYTEFRQEYRAWSQAHDYHLYDRWMERDLNNSHLALIATYQEQVPVFLNMLSSVDGNLETFYHLVKEISEKDKQVRKQILAGYASFRTSLR